MCLIILTLVLISNGWGIYYGLKKKTLRVHWMFVVWIVIGLLFVLVANFNRNNLPSPVDEFQIFHMVGIPFIIGNYCIMLPTLLSLIIFGSIYLYRNASATKKNKHL